MLKFPNGWHGVVFEFWTFLNWDWNTPDGRYFLRKLSFRYAPRVSDLEISALDFPQSVRLRPPPPLSYAFRYITNLHFSPDLFETQEILIPKYPNTKQCQNSKIQIVKQSVFLPTQKRLAERFDFEPLNIGFSFVPGFFGFRASRISVRNVG